MTGRPRISGADATRRRLETLHGHLAVDLLNYLARRADAAEDVADLLSETFLVAWRHIDRVPTGAGEARIWMFMTARTTLVNWRRGRRRRHALADEFRSFVRAGVDGAALEHPVLIVERLDVASLVDALPANQRELITLVHWDGFTLTEAAAITRTSESAAQGRYQRARKSLLVALESGTLPPTSTSTPRVPAARSASGAGLRHWPRREEPSPSHRRWW